MFAEYCIGRGYIIPAKKETIVMQENETVVPDMQENYFI
jgi:hypothetical protein